MVFENNIEIYSSRDKIREQLITYAKDVMELNDFDFNKTSYLSYFINMLSVMTADLIYYNSSVWKEFFLTKAQQRDSVINLSAMLGYQPGYATPASASVLMSIPLDFTSGSVNFKLYGSTDIDGNKTFKFYAGNIVFSLLNTLQFTITNSSGTYLAEIREMYQSNDIAANNATFKILPWEITVVSGKSYLNFICTVSQVYEINSGNIEFQFPALKKYEFFTKDIDFNDGYIANININSNNESSNELLKTNNINTTTIDTDWISYSSIPLIPEDTYGYVTRQTSKGIRVYFGNGIYGKKPVQGDTCYIYLYLTNGSAGNVIPGSINKCDPIDYTDSDNKRRRINPVVINTEPAVNGEDSPSIDDIRSAAIAQVSTNDRLVTKYDYDNFAQVVENIPIRSILQVLKRSDLKRNEISLFTDLIYNDTVNNSSYVVPTRNTLWDLDTTSYDGTNTSGDPVYIIRNDDIITIDGEDYVSMFNVEINPETLDTRYYYTADELQVPVTITNSYSPNTMILPTYVNFYISRESIPNDDKSYFEAHYTIVDQTIDPANLICQVTLPWSGAVYNLPHSVINKKFYLDFTDYIVLNDIPEDKQRLKFNFYYTYPTIQLINTSYVDAIITKTLDSFMMSQVKQNSDTNYYVYDVPVILKDYYDNVDKSKFNFYVLSKIIEFDVTKYRMLTDYCNLKFSNTTGNMNNMTLNPVTKTEVYDINPNTLPTPVDGTRYAVSENSNPWDRDGGFIAIATSYNPSGWIYEELSVNDYFYVTVLDKKMLYNGDDFVEPIQNIPVNLEIVVWVDPSWSGSDIALVSDVKNTIIDSMYPNFGYQKNILISEITRLVKSVDGVLNCKVQKPEHDIIFEYDYDDLTEEELITFTPDLVYFDSNSITIILRS